MTTGRGSKYQDKQASEQEVRNAAISALRLSRITFVVSTLIASTSTYLSLAVGNHWWPWQQDSELLRASLLTSYVSVRGVSDPGQGITDTYAISVVNNSTSPARDIYLYLAAPETVNHGQVVPNHPVGIGDAGPCEKVIYVFSVFNGEDQPIDYGGWHLEYDMDSRTWDANMAGNVPKRAVRAKVSGVYGVGGLSRIRGWSNESITREPSSGPGCG